MTILTVEQLSSLPTVSGALRDLGTLDLLQVIHDSKRSATLSIRAGEQQVQVFFRDGDIIDAELGSLRGERALHGALAWSDGTFEVQFRDSQREDAMRISTRRVLYESRSWLEERARRTARLPELSCVYVVDSTRLLEKLAELPDELNLVLKLFDGQRPLHDIVALSELDELSTLGALLRLLADAIIHDATFPARGTPTASLSARPAGRVGLRSTLDYHDPGLALLREPTRLPSRPPDRPSVERTLRGMQAPPGTSAVPAGLASKPNGTAARSSSQSPPAASASQVPPRITARPEPPRRVRARRRRISSETGAVARRARVLGSNPELTAPASESSDGSAPAAPPTTVAFAAAEPAAARSKIARSPMADNSSLWTRAIVAAGVLLLACLLAVLWARMRMSP